MPKYVELNTVLSTNSATLVPEINGRVGDNNREVYFWVKNGSDNRNITNETIEFGMKDSTGTVKLLSTVNDLTGQAIGRFSMLFPAVVYQAPGSIETAFFQIKNSDGTVVSTIPVTFEIFENSLVITQSDSDMYISDVQKVLDQFESDSSGISQTLSTMNSQTTQLSQTLAQINAQISNTKVVQANVDTNITGNFSFANAITGNLSGNASTANVATVANSAVIARRLMPNTDLSVNSIEVTGQQQVYTATVSSSFGFNFYLIRVGNLVQIRADGKTNKDIPMWVGVDSIAPAGFRPIMLTTFKANVDTTSSTFQIDLDGGIINRENTLTGTQGDIAGTGMYLTNDALPS